MCWASVNTSTWMYLWWITRGCKCIECHAADKNRQISRAQVAAKQSCWYNIACTVVLVQCADVKNLNCKPYVNFWKRGPTNGLIIDQILAQCCMWVYRCCHILVFHSNYKYQFKNSVFLWSRLMSSKRTSTNDLVLATNIIVDAENLRQMGKVPWWMHSSLL